MKIMVTGGFGFVGSHVTDELINLGHTVLAMDNLCSGVAENLKARENLYPVIGDISDPELVDQTVEFFKPDYIFHAAVNCITYPIDVQKDIATNIIGTVNIVNAAKKYGVKRITYLQTALIYGSHNRPDNPFRLDQQLNPNSSYAITKAAAESFIRHSGLDYVSFRLENHYGQRNINGAAPAFYKRLSSGQKCTIAPDRRGFIFIKDSVPLFVKACLGEGDAGVYHVSAGYDNSILEFYETMCDIMNIHQEYELITDVKPTTLSVEDSKTRSMFDWRPTHDLYEGLVQTIAWYEANGVDKFYTHLKRAV